MKKVIFNFFAAVVMAVAFAACGGGSGSLDGVYAVSDGKENALLIISGNKMKTEVEGIVVEEIEFEIVEQQKENKISKGLFVMTVDGKKEETNYEFDGRSLTVDGMVFIKK